MAQSKTNIFVLKGVPLLFYIFPGEYSGLLQELIQDNGGQISSICNDNTINIAGQFKDIPPEVTADVYGYDYIIASLRANCPLFTLHYRLHKEYEPESDVKHAFAAYVKYKTSNKSIAYRDVEHELNEEAVNPHESTKGCLKAFTFKTRTVKARGLNKDSLKACGLSKNSVKASEFYKDSVKPHGLNKESVKVHRLDKGSVKAHGLDKGSVKAHGLDKGSVKAHGLEKGSVKAHGLDKGSVKAHGLDEGTVKAHGLDKGSVKAHGFNKGSVKTHELNEGSLKTYELIKDVSEAHDLNKGAKKGRRVLNPMWTQQSSRSTNNCPQKKQNNKCIDAIQSNKIVQQSESQTLSLSGWISCVRNEGLSTHVSTVTSFKHTSTQLSREPSPKKRKEIVTSHSPSTSKDVINYNPSTSKGVTTLCPFLSKDDRAKDKVGDASLSFAERSLLRKHAEASCGLSRCGDTCTATSDHRVQESTSTNTDVEEEEPERVPVLRRKRRVLHSTPVPLSDSEEEFLRRGRQDAALLRSVKPASRMPYSNKEREAILHFISDNNYFHKVKGRSIWKELEERNVLPGRSWQSLMEHFRKQILPNLHKYRYMLSEQEMKKISGFKEWKSSNTRRGNNDSDTTEGVLVEETSSSSLPLLENEENSNDNNDNESEFGGYLEGLLEEEY